MKTSDMITPNDASRSIDADAAALLASEMGAISEECYCAGWMSGLEDALWSMLQGGARRYGLGEVSDEQVTKLRRLHEKCGGWIYWCDDDEKCGERFVPTQEWIEMTQHTRGARRRLALC